MSRQFFFSWCIHIMLQEVEKSFTFWGSSGGDVVHPAECMHQLLEQVRRHKVNIDGNVCAVMVTTLVLEVNVLIFSTIFYLWICSLWFYKIQSCSYYFLLLERVFLDLLRIFYAVGLLLWKTSGSMISTKISSSTGFRQFNCLYHLIRKLTRIWTRVQLFPVRPDWTPWSGFDNYCGAKKFQTNSCLGWYLKTKSNSCNIVSTFK